MQESFCAGGLDFFRVIHACTTARPSYHWTSPFLLGALTGAEPSTAARLAHHHGIMHTVYTTISTSSQFHCRFVFRIEDEATRSEFVKHLENSLLVLKSLEGERDAVCLGVGKPCRLHELSGINLGSQIETGFTTHHQITGGRQLNTLVAVSWLGIFLLLQNACWTAPQGTTR